MTAAPEAFDAVIIGAGAAGLMCALTAGQRGRRVLLLEHTDKAGAKILISGGRPLQLHQSWQRARSLPVRQPAFLHFGAPPLYAIRLHRSRSASSASPFTKRRSASCSATARRARSSPCCSRNAHAGGVDLRVGQTVTSVSQSRRIPRRNQRGMLHGAGAWCWRPAACPSRRWARPASATTSRGASACASPKRCRGWCRFKAGPDADRFRRGLAGVSLEAIASFEKQSFRENILFTHRGLSGPAILQISSYWRRGRHDHTRSAAGSRRQRLSRRSKAARPKARCKPYSPKSCRRAWHKRLAAAHCRPARWPIFRDRTLRAFADRLKALGVPSGRDGRLRQRPRSRSAASTRAICHRRRWARAIVTGLYAIGEAVDVTGWLGGYNFQWAWSSGWSAGQAI